MTVEQINAVKDAIMEIIGLIACLVGILWLFLDIGLIACLVGILWLFLVSNGVFDKRD